ncbi:MAG: class I mannose-6-phosphate isomerase [Verrucomicrobiae bacterium]|nr:class I mannose-6-phosphate isomerase [Verrucomicrobiae bacterium]
MLYPLKFQPIFKERIWGGRNLERLYGKALPPGVPIGESWEISDRPGDVSVIANGPLAGHDLHWLVQHRGRELLGEASLQGNRFPLLIKLLDAQEKLSLQVHPPASQAATLGGEPKTEMWFIADAAQDAELFVGLKRGITREIFQQKMEAGTVADCFHRIHVKAGDTMFLPSGRVHAIGAGLVLFEIQQNSDTTYRVFDWNRVGLDGKPRELHVAESLASIDFDDFEPALTVGKLTRGPNFSAQRLVNDPLFTVDRFDVETQDSILWRRPTLRIIGLVKGSIAVASRAGDPVDLKAGEFCLLPASLNAVELAAQPGTCFLHVEVGRASSQPER